MNNILISVNDNQKAEALIDFLRNLSFVQIKELTNDSTKKSKADFFTSAGIWADRKISSVELRDKAWSRES